MFKGKEHSNTKARRDELAKFPSDITVIYNKKAYANRENLKQQARQQYKQGSPYSPSEAEPRLLVLNAFTAHKKKKTAEKKAEEEDFVTELKKLNCTISIVPPGATGYVQVLDGFANRKIKQLIREEEEAFYDDHEDEFKAGKFSMSDRRVLLGLWVSKVFKTLHNEFGHLIVKAFEQVGLSLNPDGSEDWKLKIRDLPGLSLFLDS